MTFIPPNTIDIVIKDGILLDVLGLPKGITYRLIDYDNAQEMRGQEIIGESEAAEIDFFKAERLKNNLKEGEQLYTVYTDDQGADWLHVGYEQANHHAVYLGKCLGWEEGTEFRFENVES